MRPMPLLIACARSILAAGRRRLICFALTLLLSSAAVQSAAGQTVAILLSEEKGSYAEFNTELQKQLARRLPGVTVRTALSVAEATATDVDLIVAVGTAAQQAVADLAGDAFRQPVLAVLTPRTTFERMFGRTPRTTALYLDQPEERQLALLTLLPGNLRSFGVVSSLASTISLPRLRLAASKFGLRLVAVPVTAERNLAQAVQEAVSQSEVLLAHPDPGVFSPPTVQNILLSTYRARLPVIGFSAAYTRAGALASLHSSIAQLAEESAAMAVPMLAGRTPAARYPQSFEVTVNRQVARSLGFEMPAESVLVKGIHHLAGKTGVSP